MTRPSVHLLDVTVAIAIVDDDHAHNAAANRWFDTPGLQWGMCAFTEAGVLRYLTNSTAGGLSLPQATIVVGDLKDQAGYHFQQISSNWDELTETFAKRLHGHRQITDAYLLGIAIREGLTLTTFDKAILSLAGEHRKHVLLLDGEQLPSA